MIKHRNIGTTTNFTMDGPDVLYMIHHGGYLLAMVGFMPNTGIKIPRLFLDFPY